MLVPFIQLIDSTYEKNLPIDNKSSNVVDDTPTNFLLPTTIPLFQINEDVSCVSSLIKVYLCRPVLRKIIS